MIIKLNQTEAFYIDDSITTVKESNDVIKVDRAFRDRIGGVILALAKEEELDFYLSLDEAYLLLEIAISTTSRPDKEGRQYPVGLSLKHKLYKTILELEDLPLEHTPEEIARRQERLTFWRQDNASESAS